MRSPPPSTRPGFIAAYLSALVLGNLGLPHRAAVHSFASALGSIAQIGLFVLLGLLASPTELPEPDRPGPRHRAGAAAASPGRCRCSRLADAVPDTAARPGLPVLGRPARRRPDRAGDRAGDAGHGRTPTGSSTSSSSSSSSSPWCRPRPCPGWPGGSGSPSRCRTVDLDVETTPLETMGADVIQVTVGRRGPGCTAWSCSSCGCRPGANVTLVVRDGKGFVPQGQTVLRHGDQLLVVSTRRRAPQDRAADPRRRRGRPPRGLGLTRSGSDSGRLRVPPVDFRAA